MSSFTLFVAADDDRREVIEIVAAAAGVALVVKAGETCPGAEGFGPAMGGVPVISTAQGPIARTVPILQYLAGVHAHSALHGDCLYTDAVVDQWLQVFLADIAPNLRILQDVAPDGTVAEGSAVAQAARGKPVAPKAGLALRSRAEAATAAVFAALAARLETHSCLVTERITLADIAVASQLLPLLESGAMPSVAPAIARWALACAHHAAFVAVRGAPTEAAVNRIMSAASAVAPAAPAAAAAAAAAASGAGAPAAASAAASAAAPAATGLTNSGSVSAGALSAPPAFATRWSRGRARASEVLTAGAAIIGQTVTVGGWVRSARKQSGLAFIDVSDGSTMAKLQFVVKEGIADADSIAAVAKVGTGACVRGTGKVVATRDGKSVELECTSLSVMGDIPDPSKYPVAKARLSMEALREHQHLRPRTNALAAVTRVRNACAFATHRFFQERGFLYIHTPIITSADCEGAGEMFSVTTMMPADPKGPIPRTEDGSIDYSKDFFGNPAGLTVSGQLQVESFACSMSDVYTFGPTFRAENSHTSRHLSEFWMIEPEIAFAGLEEDMSLAEDYLKYCTAYVLEHCAADIEFFDQRVEKGLRDRLQNVVNEDFVRLSYTDAIEILCRPEVLKKAKFSIKPSWGMDMRSEHERYLTDVMFKKPVIVNNYPKDIKAFYMRANDDGRTVQAMDVLVPRIGELMGGSVREERLDVLEKRMEEMDVPKDNMQWYLDLRRFGTVPHAGFGLGFERLVMYVTGMENIRDVIPFPRYPGHADV
ncbi:hypothetical protein FNF31_00024 [Cafeteria roenbergensis]|uniref:asparagine--tRNA ligase n=1 Tax=Cafeteria roenbergensis TaxID=33653 RepID=A0A5A8DTY8_CAFRO|nr:hypothetical protein FNF31_00024 [Cafeteria roenbergensis]KAA0170607.1 hypothetical protein FNF28_01369 [Cafeteria roenbergensis]